MISHEIKLKTDSLNQQKNNSQIKDFILRIKTSKLLLYFLMTKCQMTS